MGKSVVNYEEKLAGAVAHLMCPSVLPDAISWIEDNINLDYVSTSAASGKVKLRAWQRAIVEAQFDPQVRKVIICAVEQLGKSVSWQWPMIYRMLNVPSPELVVFEADSKSEGINTDAILPIVMSVPELAGMIGRYDAQKSGYRIANGAVIDFQGAGAANITSRPYKIAILDEIDRYCNCSYQAAKTQLRDAMKRLRSYRDKGKLIVCCSPKNNKGGKSLVWELYEESSQNYWTLRCKECNNLTMRSCDIRHLCSPGGKLFPRNEDGTFVAGSPIVLKCPICGHEHQESDAAWCSSKGGYVAETPDVRDTQGYQIGALAEPGIFKWAAIAAAQVKAGGTSDLETQADFDNSWRGKAWKKRRENDTSLERRQIDYTNVKIERVLMSCDTQDDCWYYVIRGYDKMMNSYLLSCGKAVDKGELERAWTAEYEGKRCCAGIVDLGGHRNREVIEFLRGRAGYVGYRGNSGIGVKWKLSTESQQAYIVNQKPYHRELCYLIYNKPPAGDYSWYLPQLLNDDYAEQIRAWHPKHNAVDKSDYDAWVSSGYDHFFACEKMWLALREILEKQSPLAKQTAAPTATPEAKAAQEEALRRSQERRRALRRENEI